MTEQQQSPKKRVRINVSTSVKGIKSYDCTVELDGYSAAVDVSAAALMESDELVAALDKRYPAAEA